MSVVCHKVIMYDMGGKLSEALLNFHKHYCEDDHSSVWCQYHPKVTKCIQYLFTISMHTFQETSDGKPYRTINPLKCISEAFLQLLNEMAKKS